MIYCCVPGCPSRSNLTQKDILFYSLPINTTNGIVDPFRKKRLTQWLKLIDAPMMTEKWLKDARICSKHFVSGRPAMNAESHHVDWVPSVNLAPTFYTVVERQALDESHWHNSVQNIITNLPEITEEFDVPEYITLDKYIFNEQKIESDLIHKYLTNPICDENGYYRNDHDYLGLPIIRTKTDDNGRDSHFKDHNYSTNERPACLYKDLGHFCNICQYNYLNLFSFNAHMMMHTVRNDVVCQMCRQTFLTTTCLNNHIALHATICDICGTEVPLVQLKAHQEANVQQKKSFKARDAYKVPEKAKINFCIFCMKGFVKKRPYCRHMMTHKVVNTSKKVIGYNLNGEGRFFGKVPKKVSVPNLSQCGT